MAVTKFEARVVFFSVARPITKGFAVGRKNCLKICYPCSFFFLDLQVVVHCNSNQRPGSISKLISQINPRSGDVVKNKPRYASGKFLENVLVTLESLSRLRCFGKNTSGVIEITMDKPICLEIYAQLKEMGRVTLRADGVTVAAGVVTKLLPMISSD